MISVQDGFKKFLEKDSEKWAHLYDEVDFQIISHVAFRAYCAGVTDMADEAIESMGGIVNAPR